ncbi:hypothetical protein [Halobaculum sp. D14]|uniref:hypothetical protein n=1 Tax=Halobaculum sp. D14 TaxID=3421642 RepID=UPI003EBA8A6F
MDRREFIAAVGAGAAVGVAGCVGGGTGGDGGDDTDTSGTPTSTPADTTKPPTDGATPTITGRSFSRTGDAATPQEDATVRFAESAVTCSGVIRGKNGCMRAALADATYDPDADRLTVTVETVSEGGPVCTQQIVYRAYDATVRFDGGLPGAVTVLHRSTGETRTVAETTR